MAGYCEEFKYSIVIKIMPPESQPVSKLAKRKETALAETAALLVSRKEPMQVGGAAGTPDQHQRSQDNY